MIGAGVDPGPSEGAAATITDDGGSWVASWRLRRSSYVVSIRSDGEGAEEWLLDGPALRRCVLEHVRRDTPIAVEAVHVGRVRGSQLVALSEDAGAWVGVLGLRGPVARPLAATWRREVLRVRAGTVAADCDRAAVAAVLGVPLLGRRGEAVTLGLRWQGAPPTAHEADALCLAAWASGRRA